MPQKMMTLLKIMSNNVIDRGGTGNVLFLAPFPLLVPVPVLVPLQVPVPYLHCCELVFFQLA
jgi:hypothetical protein